MLLIASGIQQLFSDFHAQLICILATNFKLDVIIGMLSYGRNRATYHPKLVNLNPDGTV